jgi:hypothetical protein
MGIAVSNGVAVHRHSIWCLTVWVLGTMISSMFVAKLPMPLKLLADTFT